MADQLDHRLQIPADGHGHHQNEKYPGQGLKNKPVKNSVAWFSHRVDDGTKYADAAGYEAHGNLEVRCLGGM
ncbi:hypothetical protein [Desulfolithobacter sp.]